MRCITGFRHAYHGHRAKVRDVVPSPDGRFFVASSPDKTLSIWPLQHADDVIPEPVVMTPADDYVYGIDLHPLGPYLVTAGEELRIWRLNRGLLAAGAATHPSVVVRRWAADEQPRALVEVAWSSEDALVVTRDDDTTQAWTIDGDQLVAGADEPAPVVPQSADGVAMLLAGTVRDCMLAARADGGIEAWRAGAGAPSFVGKHELGLADVALVAIAPDGKRVVVAGRDADHVARLYAVPLDAAACSLAGSTQSTAIPGTPSGNVLSSVSYPGGGGAAPRHAAFSADGGWLLTSDGEGAGALLWRIDPARGLVHAGELLGHHAGADALAFAPDGRHAITAGNDGEVILHRVDLVRDPVAIERLEYLEPPSMPGFFSLGAAWSPSGRRVAVVGGWGPHGRVWIFELDVSRR